MASVIRSTEYENGVIRKDYTEIDPLRENFNNDVHKSRTFKRKYCYLLKNITVEPTMFLYINAAVIYLFTSQNLSLEKACRVNLNYTDEICDSLKMQTVGEQNQYERDVQRLVTNALAWRTYITATIPCLFAIFIGAWSDKTGYRKIFIIITLFGQLAICTNGILNTYFLLNAPLEIFVFSEAILDGLTGSFCVCFLTMFAFISAITTNENRTFRMGLISFSFTVGFPIGMSMSGVLLRNMGYYGCYGVSGGINMINLLYNIFILKDPKKTEEQKMHDGKGFLHFFYLFFDLSNIKETVKVMVKDAPNNRRVKISVMLISIAILFGPMHGELSIMYISTRYRFNWDEVKFSIFQTYNFITHTIGTIFSLVVFSKYLQWHDSILGIISTMSKIAASFVYCFAANERIFFIAPLVDILNGTSLLAMRSLVSKLVLPEEFGKINSIFALTENLMPLIYIPLYTKVYIATMEVLPGAVFLMGSAMTIPAVIVFIWLLVDHKMSSRRFDEKNGTNKNV